jgi:peptide/nickel transport system substrate-binding protein
MFWGGWFFLVDSKGNLQPDLATEIPTPHNGGISADGLSITYHLRKGVRWHDGAPFDARDVIFTYHAIMNPANNIVTRSGYDQIAEITAPDPFIIKIRLKKPYAPAVATFFAPSQAPFCILPAHLLAKLPDINHADYARKPIGTGAFVVTRYQPGIELDLEANPHYWRGAPRLKAVRWLNVPNANTAVVMMRTGEADIFPRPPETVVPELETIAGIHLVHRLWDQFEYLGFNLTHAPLDDRRLRIALSMAVDRPRLLQTILHGNGAIANGDQPGYSWAFDPQAKSPPFDPAAAARMLDELGWQVGADGVRSKDGKRLAFGLVYSISDHNASRFAPILQNAWRKLGVDITIKSFPNSLYYATKAGGGIVNSGKYDIAAEGWIGGVDPDNSTLWACDARPPNGFNTTLLCDPAVDQQINLTLTKYDQAVRRAAYWKIQELLDSVVNVDFLYWVNRNDAVRDGIGGFDPPPTVTPYWNVWNWSA